MGKFNKYLDVEVSCKESDKGNKILTFYGIKPTEKDAILDRICEPGVGPQRAPKADKNIMRAFFAGPALTVIVNPAKASEFIDTGLQSIISALVSSGNYNNDSILMLTDEVASAIETPSKADKDKLFADAKDSEAAMWANYLNKVNDPVTMEALKLYAQIYGDTVYGHALSLKNVMTIKNINPDATFVLGKTTWAKFGRGIKRGAKQYPLWMFSNSKNATPSEIKAAIAELGHGLEEFGDLGVAVQQEVQIKAQKIHAAANGNRPNLIPIKYIGYDIADTYLYNPNEEDPLVTKANISSNVVYTLNALAKEAEEKKAQEAGKQIDTDADSIMRKRTDAALNAVEMFAQNKGIKITNVNGASPSAQLVDDLRAIYSSMATDKANVLTAKNIAKVAEDCTHLTLIMANIGLDQLQRFQHPLIYTQKEGAALAPVMRPVITAIGKAASQVTGALNEGVDFNSLLTRDGFLKAFKAAAKQIGMKFVPNQSEVSNEPIANNDVDTVAQTEAQPMNNAMPTETPEMVKENFYTILNRINNADIAKPLV